MCPLAIVYLVMRTGKLLWNFAAEGGDDYYNKYSQDPRYLWGYRPIENPEDVRNFLLEIAGLLIH
jgi:hypothetical protein